MNASDFVVHISTELDKNLSNQPWPCPQLRQAMHYAVCNGGKRSRATLTYLIGTGLDLDLSVIEPIAMAIECLHAYTLVHDDLPAMDDDDWRRGKPSCHRQFDEATAILAGDALQAYAFQLLAEAPIEAAKKIEQIQYFSTIVGASGLCSGQSLDMISTADDCSLDDIYHIHHLKTGVLLGAACRLPGIAAHRDEAELQQLQNFGEKLGLLLQINDDLIDMHHNTGKSAGKDAAQNKACISNHLTAEKAELMLKQTWDLCRQNLQDFHFLNISNKAKLEECFLTAAANLLSSQRSSH